MLHQGRISPAGLAFFGTDGADGRLPRFAQRRVILFFWPILASSPNHLYIAGIDAPLARDRRQCGGPLFLKASTAPAFCA